MTALLAVASAADLAWQQRAACALLPDEGSLDFHPDRGETGHAQARRAKAVCATCAVRAECLEFALATGQRFGIWGGRSERERRRLRLEAAQPWWPLLVDGGSLSHTRGRRSGDVGWPASIDVDELVVDPRFGVWGPPRRSRVRAREVG